MWERAHGGATSSTRYLCPQPRVGWYRVVKGVHVSSKRRRERRGTARMAGEGESVCACLGVGGMHRFPVFTKNPRTRNRTPLPVRPLHPAQHMCIETFQGDEDREEGEVAGQGSVAQGRESQPRVHTAPPRAHLSALQRHSPCSQYTT